MIIQKLQTVEKLNIFDIKSVTIEHPKPVTKLLKPMKQTNKRKVYTESKAADCTLQSDFIKRHNLP